ncbi:uncharacterized protein LOC143576758 [Bidens hawaiensis]|uniref:uncharacterized protein LOC143576758 n=1 Tax=Bidens hawaiensis TaxID=980011 RepID=UPI00404B01D2
MSSLDIKLASLRIPLEDIVTATKHFAEENLLKHGKTADVYKGVLLLRSKVSINVVIQKFGHLCEYRSDARKFYDEIKIISGVKHRNIVSFIGFCDDKDERMIVMEHAANGSLDLHLSDPTFLTWLQRLQICFGVALALRYCNNDNNTRRYNMKGFKVLTDKDWDAKLRISLAFNSYEKTNPVYAFGVTLLEVLYGRKTTVKDVDHYLAKMVKNHYERLDDIIDPCLRQQMHPQSLPIFSEIAYDCLKEQPVKQRTYILKRLKEAFEIQWKHENLHTWLQKKEFACLKILLSQIKLATDNFADTYRIKSHKYDKVYKAELNHFDRKNVLTIEGDNMGELPKKAVIIARIYVDHEKTTKDFFEEIEMLTICKHPNLLSFYGFCCEDSEMILIFECAYKQTLNDYLRRISNRTSLTWEQRISICLDIAHGLEYLQNMKGKPSIIHEVIHNANVFMDENWTAKIADFRLSEFSSYPTSLGQSGQRLVDDIFSLGVILFEVLTGRLADHQFHMTGNVNGLASMVKRHFSKEKLKNMAGPRIMEEAQDSLNTFTEITYRCLVLETPSERPTLEVVIKSLEKALHIQVQEKIVIPLEVIRLATNNFDEKYLIGTGGYGAVYKAELSHLHIRSSWALKMKSKCDSSKIFYTVAIKRILSREDNQGKEGFLAELDVLRKCEHPNIVCLLGVCVEGREMLLVYEHASNGSLDEYLGSTDKLISLTWAQRLKMCIDIAHGLNYLHTNMKDKSRIIHRDIKSANILLGKNWEAKIADFGLSKVHSGNLEEASTINTKTIAGTEVYLDPEYARTGRLKKASDIYSFGVVLFEIFSGKLAYDKTYMEENDKGLSPIAQRHFEKGTIQEILDPNMMDEASELGLTLKVRPTRESLDSFSKIAYRCLERNQDKRPTIEVVINDLKEALQFQETRMKTLKISLEHIKLGVENFSDDKCIMRGVYGLLYKGTLQDNNRHKKVVVKRFTCKEDGFLKEFEVLFKYKQENIIGLVGYCIENEEKIIVYENASKGSLSMYLNDPSFSWTKRLKICIDIAKGLKFLHGGDVGQDVVIHRDIKSFNILLTDDWKAKICGFDIALTCPTNKETEYDIDDVVVSAGYCDPLYLETHLLTKESDIYSFGVILFEILCGRSACLEDVKGHNPFIDDFVKIHFQAERLEEIVFEGIKKHILLKSFAAFQRVAFLCLHEKREERPTASDVVEQLQKALEFQVSFTTLHFSRFYL